MRRKPTNWKTSRKTLFNWSPSQQGPACPVCQQPMKTLYYPGGWYMVCPNASFFLKFIARRHPFIRYPLPPLPPQKVNLQKMDFADWTEYFGWPEIETL